MILTDIHTHNNVADERRIAIVNCGENSINGCKYASVGLHPWMINNDWEECMQRIATAATKEQVRAIGECGIDLVKGCADEKLQETILRLHIELSESLQKPLILHIVKGQQSIMRLRKEHSPTQPWIIHGFRGKAQQAHQYLDAGFYLSFGRLFNSEALAETPIDRLFIESDDSDVPLIYIYETIAETIGIGIEELAEKMMLNSQHCKLLP